MTVSPSTTGPSYASIRSWARIDQDLVYFENPPPVKIPSDTPRRARWLDTWIIIHTRVTPLISKENPSTRGIGYIRQVYRRLCTNFDGDIVDDNALKVLCRVKESYGSGSLQEKRFVRTLLHRETRSVGPTPERLALPPLAIVSINLTMALCSSKTWDRNCCLYSSRESDAPFKIIS